MTRLTTLVGTLLLAGLLPAQQRVPTICNAAQAEAVPRSTTTVRVEASGRSLTETLRTLQRYAPDLETLCIVHRACTLIETESLQAIRTLRKLQHLGLEGNAFLRNRDFAELGRLARLRSLRLCLP